MRRYSMVKAVSLVLLIIASSGCPSSEPTRGRPAPDAAPEEGAARTETVSWVTIEAADTGSLQELIRGEDLMQVVSLDGAPYIVGSEEHIQWTREEGLLSVNDRVVGVTIRDDSSVTGLVSRHRGAISSVIIRGSGTLTEAGAEALSHLAADAVALSVFWHGDEAINLDALAGLGHRLRWLRLDGSAPQGPALAHLAPFTRLEALQVRGAVPTAALRHLSGRSSLRSLELLGSRLAGDELAPVATLTGLRHLALVGASADDQTLSHVASLTGLRSLDLQYSDVSSLAPLAALTGLRSLNLQGLRQVDAEDLDDLSPLGELRDLNLVGTAVDDAGLAHLSSFPRLRSLHLPEGVTQAGLRHVAQLANLRSLRIPAPVSDDALRHVSGLALLRRIQLIPGQVGDAGLAHLAGLRELRSLDLHGSQVTDGGLSHLAGMSHLRNLVLRDTGITSSGLAHLSGLGELRRLDLRQTGITSEGLPHLAGLDELRAVDLIDTAVSEEAVATLTEALPRARVMSPQARNNERRSEAASRAEAAVLAAQRRRAELARQVERIGLQKILGDMPASADLLRAGDDPEDPFEQVRRVGVANDEPGGAVILPLGGEGRLGGGVSDGSSP